MPPKFDSDAAIERLRNAIRAVFAGTFSKADIKELYVDAYNIATNREGRKLYDCVKDEIIRHLLQVQEEVMDLPGDTLLTEIYRIWTTFRSHLFLLFERLLLYFDQVYVRGAHLTTISDMGLEVFRDTVLRSVELKERILGALLQNIHRERTGEVISRLQMKSIIEMFIEIGIGTLEVYQSDFEKPFIDTSIAFFKKESREFIASNTCPDYMRKVEERRKAESERVSNYLHASTEPKVRDALERELITAHVDELLTMENSGLVFLVNEEKTDDLTRMYSLFARTPDGLNKLREHLHEHLRETGKNIVTMQTKPTSSAAAATSAPKADDDKDDAAATDKTADKAADKGGEVVVVQQLVELKDKYDRLMENAFARDKQYQHALNQAFEFVMNLEQRVAEYLSLYVDEKIKKGVKETSEDEIDTVFSKIIALFRFLQEKDRFERYYKHHLAKRLLLGKSEEDDFEKLMISKLKTECGYQFTSKLEGMFNDMRTSKEALAQFNEALKKKGTKINVDLAIQILTTGFWPMQVVPQCALPEEVQQTADVFKTHYMASHNGRRLSWQTSMGTADVQSVFGGKKFEVNMPTYMMCVMMLFNTAASLTCKEIAEATQIPANELKRNLLVMALGKLPLLTKQPLNKKVEDTDVFQPVAQFKSKLLKVKIAGLAGGGGASATPGEATTINKEIEEERQYQVDACVVRLMKTRRTMDHLTLVNETTRQLSVRFMPSPVLIKKRIESLIEREYMERSKDNRMVYNYLA